ncbi:MAG: 4-hydroxy-tetrahydrodipicolinate reductase [Kiritimatiellia bacterium]|jgi:4-hydroxy-tetrahydrodipicolinate reductase
MNTPVKILLIGAAGRMGQAITRLIAQGWAPGAQLIAAVDRADTPLLGRDAGQAAGAQNLGIPITADLPAALAAPPPARPDVAVDFSHHTATAAAAPQLAAAGIPWLVGTTGLTDADRAAIAAAARQIPVVLSANTSAGINILLTLVARAAAALKNSGYDCEIIERHHRRKKDAPSGTALALGQAAATALGWNLNEVAIDGRTGITGERPEKQIAFHAIRGGDFIGDHTVLFATDGECLELTHRATTRDTLARGALRAARWLPAHPTRPPRLYSMADVLGLNPTAPPAPTPNPTPSP